MTPATSTHPTLATRRRAAAWRPANLAALLALALFAPTAARASDERLTILPDRDGRRFDTWADGRLVDVQLLVDGQPAPLYFAPGRNDRHYLQAFTGRNYSVVLRNNTGNRVAVLLAVDGVNAVDGERTKLRSSEPMYVLGPWEQATIRGWRTSLQEIRRFVFVDEQRSYASRTGQANSDMGWIRVLAFREQRPWWEKQRADLGRVKSGYRDFNQGPVPPVPQASPVPAPEAVAADHLVFRYEYASGLRALGIQPLRGPWRDRLGERDGDLGFAKPPRW
jgi:hypothetical protein